MDSSISANKNLSIIPSNIHIPVGPAREIPAHTCTLVGCLGLQQNKIVSSYTLYYNADYIIDYIQ